MLQAVRLVTFGEATNAVKNQLGQLLTGSAESVSEIKLSRKLGNNECQLQSIEGRQVLNTGETSFGSLLKILMPDREEHTLLGSVSQDVSQNYVLEKEDRFLDFSPFEKHVNEALNNVRYFLSRALGRTTGMFSRVLKFLFGYLGFDVSSDQFSDDLKSGLANPESIKEIARLYHLGVNGAEDRSVSENFQGNEKQKALSKFVLKIVNVFDKLNPNFVSWFPLSFCFVNVLTPLLAKLGGSVGKTFKILRVINPWIDEFLSSVMGVFKHEILKVKDNLNKAQEISSGDHTKESLFSRDKPRDADKSKEEIYSIDLLDLSKEQYALKKTIDGVSSALERLIGKKNNISSIIIYILLRSYGFKDYQDFAAKTILKADFIKNLHECLVEVTRKKKAGETNASLNKEVERKFTDPKERQVARGLLALITLSRSLSKEQVTTYPRMFGSFYSWQYLFMPLITVFVGKKNLIGKLLNLIADINPVINDFCFDPLATFQEEIMAIKKESMAISDLLPTLPQVSLRRAIDKVIATGKDIWKIVKDFSGKLTFATG